MTVVQLEVRAVAEHDPGQHRLVLTPVEQIQFERQIEQVHALGVKPVAELILELAFDAEHLLDRTAAFAALDGDIVGALGGREFVEVPLRAVGGRR